MNRGLLLSGGVDSICLAYWLKPDYAITIDYGQRPAETEIRISKYVCSLLGIRHVIIRANCSELGVGDLAGKNQIDIAPESDWWPFRNQLVITLAASYAIKVGMEKLFIGSVLNDQFHKDGQPVFYELIDKLVSFQEGGLRIEAPALNISTKELILRSQIPRKILYAAYSCHTGNIACGMCRGCNKNREVFELLDSNEVE